MEKRLNVFERFKKLQTTHRAHEHGLLGELKRAFAPFDKHIYSIV
jgi:hypothetical protein